MNADRLAELGSCACHNRRRCGPVLIVRPKARPKSLQRLSCSACRPVLEWQNPGPGLAAVVLHHPCGAGSSGWAWEAEGVA